MPMTDAIPDQSHYGNAIADAFAEFNLHPTQGNLDLIAYAVLDYENNVGPLDPLIKDELTELRATPAGLAPISAKGINVGGVSIPWLGIGLVAGVVWFVTRKKG